MKYILMLFLLISIVNADYLDDIYNTGKIINKNILQEQKILLKEIKASNATINILKKKYAITNLNNKDLIKERANIIPLEIMLAQAYLESDNGKSRFAKNGYNYFGIWTYKKSDNGFIPKQREKEKIHRVQKFSSLYEAISRYAEILNSVGHHDKFRKLRLISDNPYTLAEGLNKYSQDKDYINKIKRILKNNILIKKEFN